MKKKLFSLVLALLMVVSLIPAAAAAEGEGAQEPVVNPFTDVSQTDFFFDSVLWAVENGITAGTGNGKFSPNEFCTRAQVVTFLWRAAGCPEPAATESPFTDVTPADYFCKAVLWAMEQGITAGTGNGRFSPEERCTRAQVVTFLYRSMGSPAPASQENPFRDVASAEYYFNAVLWAVEVGVTKGTSGNTFSPTAACSRAQVVTFLYRMLK